MTTRHRYSLALIVVAACGGGGNPPADDVVGDDTVDPVLVAGGGVTGAAIAGKLNIYVIAQDDGTPIAGAQVQVGALTGNTNADGLAVIEDAALTGAQTVTATVNGRIAASWIGVIGSSVTIPLEPATTPQAHVTGTIAGWDGIDDPSFGNYNLAVILYSLTDNIGAPENHITQPVAGGAPANTCIKSAVSNMCAWQMNTRAGRQIHFAVIVEGDPQGTTSDPSDDTYVLKGFAIGTSMTLTAGQQVSGESLTVVAGGRSPMTVGFQAAPGGLGDVIAIPMLDLGDDGRLPFPLPSVTPQATSTEVLTPSGQFAGTYDVVGLATPPGAATVPYSTGFARGASVGATAALPAWMPAPAVTATGGTYAFTGVDSAAVRYATFTRGTARLWNVTVLDRSASFTLPAVASNPLGTGSGNVEITAADLTEFDAGHFAVSDLTAALSRASGASTTFTP